ncbi:MAG TPA: ABC transporter ATP-binding protein [Bellilinea sp.]|nr:ABC transporter ATP-binding protein [Bellilinea sp.]
MPNPVLISTNKIVKNYGELQALGGVSVDVQPGEILAIMGPSGSGKSTLLHCMAGILPVDSGEVYFDGQRIDNLHDDDRSLLRRRSFGFVFQFGQLVPELTALDNVALPLLLNGVARKKAYASAGEWLGKVELPEKAGALSTVLSGGETQRVAVARAMVIAPKVLFADEPTGSLDSLNSELVMELIVQLARSNGTSVVMVTHEPTIAAYADREIIVRDGKVSGAAL